jgi:hypothetical protein
MDVSSSPNSPFNDYYITLIILSYLPKHIEYLNVCRTWRTIMLTINPPTYDTLSSMIIRKDKAFKLFQSHFNAYHTFGGLLTLASTIDNHEAVIILIKAKKLMMKIDINAIQEPILAAIKAHHNKVARTLISFTDKIDDSLTELIFARNCFMAAYESHNVEMMIYNIDKCNDLRSSVIAVDSYDRFTSILYSINDQAFDNIIVNLIKYGLMPKKQFNVLLNIVEGKRSYKERKKIESSMIPATIHNFLIISNS